MKVHFILVSIVVFFNVFEYNSSKYLLVNVDPGNNRDNIGIQNRIGLQNEELTSRCGGVGPGKCPPCCYGVGPGCLCCVNCPPKGMPGGGGIGGMFRKKKTDAQRCKKLNKKKREKKEAKCQKPKNKHLECCKEFQTDGADTENEEGGQENGAEDDQNEEGENAEQSVAEDDGPECEYTGIKAEKNRKKCEKMVAKPRKKMEKKCKKQIAKDKKCACECKKKLGITDGGDDNPDNPDGPGGDDDNIGGGDEPQDYHLPYWG